MPLETPPIIHAEKPTKSKLIELVNNPPQSVLVFDYKAVIWLDKLKEEIKKL